jgi:subtilisin family serine protease
MADNLSGGDSNPRTRPYNLLVTKIPREARDEFRRLARPDTYFEIKPGAVGERSAYRVEMAPEEYERARRAAEDPQSNLHAINPDYMLTQDAPEVPGNTELTYLAAQRAWEMGMRGQGVRIAPLDSGVGYTPNSVIASESFVDENPRVDNNGHGTRMASLAAPRGSGLLVGQIATGGSASTSNMAAGIYWAMENGADVITLSFSGSGEDATLADAVRSAYDRDVVFFCSMGNHGTNEAYQPAKMPHAHAIANFASATDSPDTYTAYGPHAFLTATGNEVTWYNPDGSSETTAAGGTSSAAALAGHVAALLISAGYSKGNVLRYMKRTARRTGASPNAEGSGVIQAGLVEKKIREDRPRKRRLNSRGDDLDGWGINGIEYEPGANGKVPRDGCV